MLLVYYSGWTENTHRFAAKIDWNSVRIPIDANQLVTVDEPFVLIVPTYATTKRVVPPQVVKFLNDSNNRQHIRAVVGAGNVNFNVMFCAAAKEVARKCDVPLRYCMELLGTDEDVIAVRTMLTELSQVEESRVKQQEVDKYHLESAQPQLVS